MSWIWIVIIAAFVLLAAFRDRREEDKPEEPYRIDRPHVIDDDDHECSVCRRRFNGNIMTCPYCGTCLTKRIKDVDEFIEEELEQEDWDEEDGL